MWPSSLIAEMVLIVNPWVIRDKGKDSFHFFMDIPLLLLLLLLQVNWIKIPTLHQKMEASAIKRSPTVLALFCHHLLLLRLLRLASGTWSCVQMLSLHLFTLMLTILRLIMPTLTARLCFMLGLMPRLRVVLTKDCSRGSSHYMQFLVLLFVVLCLWVVTMLNISSWKKQ